MSAGVSTCKMALFKYITCIHTVNTASHYTSLVSASVPQQAYIKVFGDDRSLITEQPGSGELLETSHDSKQVMLTSPADEHKHWADGRQLKCLPLFLKPDHCHPPVEIKVETSIYNLRMIILIYINCITTTLQNIWTGSVTGNLGHANHELVVPRPQNCQHNARGQDPYQASIQRGELCQANSRSPENNYCILVLGRSISHPQWARPVLPSTTSLNINWV